MKYLTFSMIAFFAMGLLSCGDDESTSETTLSPLSKVDTEVSAFFGYALPSHSESEAFFTTDDGDVCKAVNSIDELKAMYTGKEALPEIDFRKYTLVMGKKVMSSSFYRVESQQIAVNGNTLTLKLRVSPESGSSWPAFSSLYFWGLYPKLDSKSVIAEVIVEQ